MFTVKARKHLDDAAADGRGIDDVREAVQDLWAQARPHPWSPYTLLPPPVPLSRPLSSAPCFLVVQHECASKAGMNSNAGLIHECRAWTSIVVMIMRH